MHLTFSPIFFLYACQLQQEKFCSIGPLTTSARTRNFYAYYGYHYLGLHRPRCSLATLYHERVEVPRSKQIGWKCSIRGPRQTSHSTHLVGHSRARKVFSGLDSSRWGIIWLWFAQINCSCPTYSCDERLWNRLRWIFPRKYVLEALLYHKTQNSEG